MGKLLLTNIEDYFSNLHREFVNVGFEKYNTHILETTLFLAAYKKLRVDSTNYYAEDEDFVAVSGTFIYKGYIGTPALQNIFHDFTGDNMQKLRRDILGSYAIILKKYADVYVFVDENHTYNLYYHNDNNKFILTNTYYHIAKHVNESFILENMLDKICGSFFVDNQTPFTKIYKLMGNQSIQYNTNTKIFEIKTLELNSYPLKSTEFNASVDEMKKRLLSITKTISDVAKKITVFGTGGLDSRLVIAGFVGAGAKPDIAYWYGNDRSTNTKNQDHILSREIAEGCGLNYTDFNVEISSLIDSVQNTGGRYIERYGEMVSVYSCNYKWFEIFESKLDAEFVEFGYFGEPCRSLDSLDKNYHRYFSVESFINSEYIERFSGLSPTQSPHGDKLEEWFSRFAIEQGFNPNNLSLEECMCLNYIYRLKADTVMCNYINQYYYTTPILSQRIFSEGVLDVPYEIKTKANWMLHLIKASCPQLIKHPVFSHCTLRKLNQDSLSLVTSPSMKLTDKLESIGIKMGLNKCGVLRHVYWVFVRKDEKAIEETGHEPSMISALKKLIASHSLYENIGYEVYSKEYQFKSSPEYIELLLALMELERIEIARVH